MEKLPIVAVVGGVNVGKSTLVNRIATGQYAIVDDMPGVTRDRNYIQADWRGRDFVLIDTGGFDFGERTSISKAVAKQALYAIDEADLIIFVVDVATGILPDDEEIAKVLRGANKPVILVVNKVDSSLREEELPVFYKLGLGEPFPVSALHGVNIGDLLDIMIQKLPEGKEIEEEDIVSIAIVGKPNVGKSSILNWLLGEERVIVNEVAGTTREAIDTILSKDNEKYRVIDTAGIRRKKELKDVEYYGFVRTLRALERADLALIVVDGSEGVTEQDQKIAELVQERGCGTIVLINKWDLVTEKKASKVLQDAEWRLRFIDYAPKISVSALTGKKMEKVLPLVNSVFQEYEKRIPTSRLNGCLQRLKEEGHTLSKGGKSLKLSYLTQVKTKPPTFVFFVNHPEIVTSSYSAYLENRLRENFGFFGVPIRLRFKKKS